MRKLYTMLIALLYLGPSAFSQNVIVNPGAGSYVDLKSAFDAINAGTHTGVITIDIVNNTTETAPAVLNASGSGSASYTSIAISPAGGGARSISGAITAGSPLIDLNGADNVTIDGLNTGGNSLTIANTTVSATSGTATIRFIGGATGNTITNASVQGSGTMSVATNGAVIFFSTDANTANGNDNNTISNCDIGPAGANLPSKAILGNGSTTTTAIGNSGIVISNNNIYDYFGAAVSSSGIAINGGCNAWTVTNNRFYQTGTRTWTTGATHRAIDFNSTTATSGVQGMTVTGNIVGYASNTQTGTYTLTGAGTGAKFQGIVLNGISAGVLSNVSNNTVASISVTGVTSSGTSTSSPFTAIMVQSGPATTNNNTIGSQAATGSLVFSTNNTTATDIIGIYNFSSDNWTANNNNIGGISVTNAAASGTYLIYGMRANMTTAATCSATGNTIGGTIANSIQLSATGTASQVIGMHTSNAAASFTSNTIRNLTSNIGTGTTTTASVIGINITTATPVHTVSQNTIYNLSNTNATTANVVTGIQFTGGTGNTVQRNLIYDLSVATTSTAAEVNGIRIAAGTTTFRNNMIRIGAGIANAIGTGSTTGGINGIFEAGGSNNMYHNSVYIGGAPTAGVGPSYAYASSVTTGTRANRNNIFFNARSNGGSTGKNYAIRVGGTAPNPAGLTINNNIYFANGTGAVFGFFNTLDVANLAAWKTAVGQDAASFESDPQFNAPAAAIPDLHLHPTNLTLAEANGFDVGVTDDYDGQLRSGLTPVDIGADAGNYAGIDLTPPIIVYTPLGNTISTSNRPLTATITDITSGVPTAGIGLPVIYYRKGTSGAYVSTQATSAGGGVYNFTIDYTLVTGGSVVVGDVIQYYVVAQDGATTPNTTSNPLTGASGFTANPPAAGTSPTTPNSYLISPALNGTYTVPGSYPSLTNAGGIFEAINSGVLTGNINIEITADLLAETGTFALNTLSVEPTGSNFTAKMYPTGGARTISGTFNGTLIRMNGASRVTIDGSIGGTGTDRSLTITNTSVTTPGVVLFGSVGTTPVTNNVLKNCIIINGANTSSAVVISDATTLGNAGFFSNITIQNNDIQKAFVGVFATGGTIPQNGSNLTYTQNTLNTSGSNAIRSVGLYMQGVNGATVTNNTVANIDKANDENDAAIWLATGTINATVSNNTVASVGYAGTGAFGAIGINITSGAASTNNNITGNSISTISSSGGSSGSLARGIAVSGATSDLIIQQNNIQNIFNTNTGTFPAYGIDLAGGNNITLRNNFISNITGDMTGGAAFSTTFGIFGIRIGAGTGHQVYHNSVNLYGARSGTATSSLLTAAFGIVSTASTGIDVRNNIFANNITGGTTSIANVAVYLPSAGTASMNLTMNNNQYYYGTDAARQGVSQAGTTAGTNFYTTLAAMTAYTATLSPAATNDNASSAFTSAVPFVSANDLHLAPLTGCVTTGKGVNLPSVPTDIDGNSRNTLPFIGAHEAYEPSGAATQLAGIVAAGAATPESRAYGINGTTDYLFNCKMIATLVPSGASPVAGLVNTQVRVDTGANKMGTPRLYAARFYDVMPAINAASATGTVKLYFLQSEFDNYNLKALDSNYYPLPLTGGGNTDSLRILIYHGAPSGGFFPGNYSGTVEELSTADAGVSVVWNPAGNNGSGWWEVSFPANGFSGYFISSKTRPPLPIKVEYFRGAKQGNSHVLDWKVVPVNTVNGTLSLERSADGRNFSSIYSITASAVRMHQPFNYATSNLLKGTNYYRLKLTDDNGVVSYSGIVALLNGNKGFELVNITPNPVTEGRFKLNIATAEQLKMEVVITDMAGRVVGRQTNNLINGFNAVEVNVNSLANGMYQVMGIIGGERTKVVTFVKQ